MAFSMSKAEGKPAPAGCTQPRRVYLMQEGHLLLKELASQAQHTTRALEAMQESQA